MEHGEDPWVPGTVADDLNPATWLYLVWKNPTTLAQSVKQRFEACCGGAYL